LKSIDNEQAAIPNTHTGEQPGEAHTNAQQDDDTKTKEQPLRPSSASLYELDSLHKKRAKKVRERKSRGDVPASFTYEHQDLFVEVPEALQFDEITDKVHILALIKYQKSKKRIVHFDLHKYMELTKITSRKTARRQLASSIHNLIGVKISRSNLNKLSKNQKNYEPFVHDSVLYINGAYDRGKGWLELNPAFAEGLDQKTRPMLVSPLQFQLKGTAYYVLNTLMYYKQVNFHNSAARQNRIRLGNLLDHCPNLPTWAEVKAVNRNYKTRIIKPLDNALNELTSEIEYSFIDADGNTQNSIYNLPLENFLDCMLVINKWKSLNQEQLNRIKKRKKSTKKSTKKTPSEK
jgi:hypothetical protein